MILYECLKCKKTFNRKSNFNKHLNKLRHCDVLFLNDISITTKLPPNYH